MSDLNHAQKSAGVPIFFLQLTTEETDLNGTETRQDGTCGRLLCMIQTTRPSNFHIHMIEKKISI
jgi:hypothetical protein